MMPLACFITPWVSFLASLEFDGRPGSIGWVIGFKRQTAIDTFKLRRTVGEGGGVHLNAEAEEDEDFVAKDDLSPNITTARTFSPGLCFLASSYF
jgi:hypothetical protein